VNVHLTPELKKLVEEEVASGRYASATDVIQEALRLFEDERRWRAEVRQSIADGVAQANAGELVDGDEAFDRLRKRIDARRKKSG